MSTQSWENAGQLQRRLGVFDAVVIGLGSMIGAGIFAALGPAAAAAGSGLLVGFGGRRGGCVLQRDSSARLAARFPQSGGTYVYGRERLGDFWGYLAGWSFVVGKTASCAAMALTVGAYVWPASCERSGGRHCGRVDGGELSGRAEVSAADAGDRRGHAGRAGVRSRGQPVLGPGGRRPLGHRCRRHDRWGAACRRAVFFAFAGYARIATLGEEVRDPARTIPRAIPMALGITLVVYAAVAVAVLAMLGARVGASSAPLADAVRAAGVTGLVPVVQIGAAIAALGSLLALVLGVSRTTLAMARDHHLPHVLAAVHPRFKVPHRAELAVAAVVVVIAATVDLRGAIGFSSFGVLIYYGIANAAAWTLTPEEGRPARLVPVIGVVGCVVLAFALPPVSVLVGAAVIAIGALLYGLRHAPSSRSARSR